MMLQMDGSLHDWLEGRGAHFTLIGGKDDATSHVWARFEEAETTWGYLDLLREIFEDWLVVELRLRKVKTREEATVARFRTGAFMKAVFSKKWGKRAICQVVDKVRVLPAARVGLPKGDTPPTRRGCHPHFVNNLLCQNSLLTFSLISGLIY